MVQSTIKKDYPSVSELTEKEKLEYSIDINKIILKKPFESNRKYRDYWLHEITPDGKDEHFYYVNKLGKLTHTWFEELIDEKWQHVESIPFDAFVGLPIAYIENNHIMFTNKCTPKERNIIASSLAFALEV